MIKFIKYELKGSYKFFLGIFIVASIASGFIQMYLSNIIKQTLQYQFFDKDLSIMLNATAFLILISSIIAVFLYIANSFKKEVDNNRAYLTFTLPLTGNQILASKLIVATFWLVFLGLSIMLINLGLASILFGTKYEIVKLIVQNLYFPESLAIASSNFASLIISVMFIYLAITLSKVTIRNKKIGGVWFLLFIALSLILSVTLSKVTDIFPYYLDLSNFEIKHILSFSSGQPAMTAILNFQNSVIIGAGEYIYLNIAGSITQLVVIVLTFLTTGYLLENKINI